MTIKVAFYACHSCGRVHEVKWWLKNHECSRCGGKSFHPFRLGFSRLWFFIFTHPSYILKAWKEEREHGNR